MFLKWLLFLCVCFLSLGQYSSVISVGDSKLYIFDVLIPIFSFSGLFYFLVSRKSFRINKYFVAILIFVFIASFSLVLAIFKYNREEKLLSAFYLFRLISYTLSGIVISNMLLAEIIDLRFISRMLLFSITLISLLGFLQLIVLPDFTALDSSLGWDPHKNRLASVFFDPNFTGGYIVLGLGLLVFLGIAPSKLIIPSIALFATFSRSSWAFAAVVIFVYGFFRSRKLLLISLVLGFLVYFAVPRVQTRLSGITDPADSASFRLISWGNTLQIAKHNLLTGVGFNTFRYVQQDYGFVDVGEYGGHSGAGSDSSFLLVLATTGVLGFIVFVIAYFYPIYDSFRKGDVLISALLAGLFVHCQFINSLFYPQIMFLWMTLIGVYSAVFSYRKV